ncbi:MAG TPA: hypothetical protein VGM90_35155 [Kofleriaceae bacterium]|jgi:hypothetical protein
MRWIVSACALLALGGSARADRTPLRCDDQSTAELEVDGLLDDWSGPALTKWGSVGDGFVALRCSWDGTALAIALDVIDDKVVRFAKGAGEQDHVKVSLAAGGKPILVDVYPANAMAKSKVTKPARVTVGDSLQPKGFSIELRIPASVVPSFSTAVAALDLDVTFVDADRATGGDTAAMTLNSSVELGDRKDLLDDFMKDARLMKSDIKLDAMADVDPDRRGKERIVYGGNVIGVITDKYGFVQMPASPNEIKKVELVPLGKNGLQVIAATVKQSGNGGSRDLLMMWTVWSGQLQPLKNIELRKEMGKNRLSSTWKIERGKKGPELWVTPEPAVGFSADNFNEEPADDADSILVPWDAARGGYVYTLKGAELQRRDIPVPNHGRAKHR